MTLTTWLLVLIAVIESRGQSVGVVLSGGGATALAHVGFLKALEEHDIPIDYIGGTSMGAVIAAMYASGYSVAELDSLVRSDEFMHMATGFMPDELQFYLKHYDSDAGFVNLKYGGGKNFTNSLPTNLINPVLMDWNFMEDFSQADAASSGNFDSLFIPLRCIAADVQHKKQIIFRNGPINIAARASCTYPFYLPPRRVDGNLLFDGGIYNNFPVDVIYTEFLPDVILGCNVSGIVAGPDEDDVFSQLQSMILFRSEYTRLCENTIVIEPGLENIGTFDFELMSEATQIGYTTTIDSISVIQNMIQRRVTLAEKNEARKKFRARFKPIVIEHIEIEGLDKSQRNYVRKIMGRKSDPIALEKLKKPYFRIFDDDKIKSIFPVARYNNKTGMYSLILDVKKEKDLMLSFGGNYSSRSINTGYIGLRYNVFGITSATLSANTYFGRFYGSVNGNVRWDISGVYPVSIQGGFTLNRWDFYKSLATFFEDVKPSYVLMNERFGNLSISTPAGNKGMIRTDLIYSYMFDQYYQTPDFISTDTADRTDFDAGILRLTWERNTLNKKQYANRGTFFSVSGKGVLGVETIIPGSTSVIRDTTETDHLWYSMKMQYSNFFLNHNALHLGFSLEAVASTQDFFHNYIASSIAAPAYTPIPESRTLFMPQFRAHNYAAGGMMFVISPGKNFDIRMEGYMFNPFGTIVRNSFNEAAYDWQKQQYFIGSGSLILHSPLGPLSISANYYDKKEEPWSFLFNFGYIIFNRSSRD
ncbi:MAG: patatin-like phospholipase family protein [Flavobacteriales bacterium]|nr:patatin-like phospholipase family protein [Flavobacteriales bacterium]